MIVGILFRKDAGQHILKNPLVINGIIEKVPNITQPVGNQQLYTFGISHSILCCLQKIYHKGLSSLIAGADLQALLPLDRYLARDACGLRPYFYSSTIP